MQVKLKKSLVAGTVAASMAAGGFAGLVLGTPGIADAAQTADAAASWVDDALSGLVTDGTITQEQSDAVETALQDARPAHGPGRGHGMRHLAAVAEALGIAGDDLRTALRGGQTIAEVAAANDVDVQTVVDAIADDHRQRLDEAVAAGELTQEQADERLAQAEQRATAMVDGELPARSGPGHRPGRHGGHGDAPDAEAPEDPAG